MRIDLPACDLTQCRENQDCNCYDPNYETCRYKLLRDKYEDSCIKPKGPKVPIKPLTYAGFRDHYECGSCGYYIGGKLIGCNYCPNCGQAIEWEE